MALYDTIADCDGRFNVSQSSFDEAVDAEVEGFARSIDSLSVAIVFGLLHCVHRLRESWIYRCCHVWMFPPLCDRCWSFTFLFDCRTRPVLVAMFLTRSSSFAKQAVTAFCLCSSVPGFLRSCLRFRLWGCSRLRSYGCLLHELSVRLSRLPWPGLWD